MENKPISKVLHKEQQEFEHNLSAFSNNCASNIPAQITPTQVGILALIDQDFPEVHPHEVLNPYLLPFCIQNYNP